MAPAVLSITAQAAAFSIASTLLAQAIAMYQAQSLRWIDATSLLQFLIIAVVMTPPNYAFQSWLEETFPARPVEEGKGEKKKEGKEEGKLSIPNTVTKFVLDQSVGACANTVGFIILLNSLKGVPWEIIRGDIVRDTFPMIKAGWSFWPMVSLSNLVIVPFEYRHIVGNVSGLLWGTYVNLKMA